MNIRVKGDVVEIEGYVNAVERKSKTLQDRFGEFVERIKAGAFSRAIKKNPNIRILLNHDWDRDLGGTDSNLKLEEDAIGLHARATIQDAEVAEDARKGNLVGWSFGFEDVKDGVEITQEEGLPVRNVKDLDLYEVSLLNRKAIPAYDGTLVTVRALDDKQTVIKRSVVYEFDDNIEIDSPEETEPPLEARAEVEEKQDNEHADESGAVDYTKYKEIIAEMKGEN